MTNQKFLAGDKIWIAAEVYSGANKDAVDVRIEGIDGQPMSVLMDPASIIKVGSVPPWMQEQARWIDGHGMWIGELPGSNGEHPDSPRVFVLSPTSSNTEEG
jgi:hypothetical protein